MQSLLSKPGITNWEIIAFLKKHELHHFKGVFSCNNIPTYLTQYRRFHIICNLSPEGMKGSHFITIMYIDGVLLILDSLGLHVTLHNHIYMFLTQLKITNVLKNKHQIQPYDADTCGLYCIYFCLLYETTNYAHIIPFTKNVNHNDAICQKNIISLSTSLQRKK